jgi:predicted transcriptional regulator
MKNLKTLKQELLENAEVRQAYVGLEPEYKLAHNLLKARIAKKMTQAELAKRAGVSQVIVARLESGTTNPTIDTVSRVANILDKRLKLVNIK